MRLNPVRHKMSRDVTRVPARTAIRCAMLFGVIALGACGAESPLVWHDEGDHRWAEVRGSGRRDAGFTRVSAGRAGIDFENRLSRDDAIMRDHLLVGSGVALGDMDGDGRVDVYFSRLEGDNVLYRNVGKWRFEDVTADAGVAAAGRYSTGAVFVDVDGDRDLDLFVTALGGPNALFRNNGAGRFEDVTSEAGLMSSLGSTTATFADVDGDGDLDVYVANYKVESAADALRPYDRPSVDLVVEEDGRSVIAEAFRDFFRLELREGREVAVEQADPDRLYLNDGAGVFTAVSWTDGAFLDVDGRPLDRDVDDFALAARFYDIDGDGDPDLYVCDDFDDPDHFWINDGTGTFRAAAPLALRTTSHASMAVDFADIDRDGDVDFFVADMLSPDPGRRLSQIPLHAALEKPAGRIADRPQVGRNTLFANRGDGTFAQVAEMAGVDGSEWTWGSAFLDVDLDGYEDLLVANGHGRDMQDGDALRRISDLRGSVTWDEAKSLYPDRPTANRAFRNRGDMTFEDVGVAWRFGDEDDVSHGLAYGDLDGDGDLDVVVNRLNQAPALLRNDASAARIAVRLIGDAPNTVGIGARVRLQGGAVPLQERQVTAGGLYLSGADAQVTFASRTADQRLEVRWRDGRVSNIDGVRAGRVYEVRQAGARAASDETAVPVAALFEDVSASLGQRHHESEFDDFGRQPLLPYRLSRLGPGLTWIDIDGDGDSDLLVPAGQGGSADIMLNEGGRFRARAVMAATHDQTELLPVWNAAGALSVLVGATSYDAGSPDEARALVSVVRIGTGPGAGPEPMVPPHLSSIGPMAQADVDGDGDLDLFVGGRSVPAAYPLPATSRLFLSQDGVYMEASPTEFTDLGMVSGAVFTDIDGDGDPDLALALEWGAVRLFANDAGRFTDVTGAWGLSGMTGLWSGVTAGDLDGDGRMDLVATNEGLNTRLATSADRPVTLVHGDVDRNGSWEVFAARARSAAGPLFPLVRFEQARGAIPGLRARVAGFAEYSEATLATVLGVEPDRLFRSEARTLEHVVMLNRGGSFDVRPLPRLAQTAPARHAGVADVDGDGREDLFISQNFYPTEGFTPRYDAGRGLLMKGDGAGGLTVVEGDVSGIAVYGDQRGAAFADYDADGRVDLAVAQNGAETKLFRNVGARPGLRVVLTGPVANPSAIGARVRIGYGDRWGPVREIHGGAGYWSMDDPVQVMGLDGVPVLIWVRWPDGTESETAVPEGAREVRIRSPSP